MMIRGKLDDALSLVIPCELTGDMNLDDLEKLMLSYAVIEQARKDMFDFKITPDEYIQLCESHNVNVDSYMETIEHNLIELKLM